MTEPSLAGALRADVRAKLGLIRVLHDLHTTRASLVEQLVILRGGIEGLLDKVGDDVRSPVMADLAIAEEVCEELGRQMEIHRRAVGMSVFGIPADRYESK